MSGSYDPTQAPNPYDPTSMGMASQQPGMLGVSPSGWQSLAALGSGMVLGANQRTADGHLANGTGFAGGFASGVNSYLQNQNQQAQMRSNLAHQGQETQGLALQNQLTASQNKIRQQFYQNPALLNQLLGGSNSSPFAPTGAVQGPLGGGGPVSGGAVGGPLGGTVAQLESGGRTNTPGIVGDGGAAAGPMQVHQAALTDVNNKMGTNYTLPQLAANPQLGTQVGNVYLQMQQNRFPGHPDLALAAYNAGPTATQNAVQSGQGVGGLPPSAQNYVQRGMSIYNGGQYDPAQGLAISQQLMERANRVEMLKSLGLPMPQDPAALRAQALAYLQSGLAGPTAGSESAAKANVQLQTAGPIAGAEANAKNQSELQYAPTIAGEKKKAEFPYTTERVAPGGVLSVGGHPAFSVPQRSEEVITQGPMAGTRGQVYRDPLTGAQIPSPQGAAPSQSGLPGGFVATQLSPQAQGYLEGAPKIAQNFIEHDNKMVDEDLAHVIENVTPAKQQLFMLRGLNEQANPGAAGEFRANFKNWVQTFAPDFVSQVTGDASPAQEFKKIALMGAGKQERGDLGARGGFRAIEMYVNANPNLENQPTANHDMANALLISHQYHEDYATGATDFFNKQIQGVNQNQSTQGYQKLSNYDQNFIGKFRPELYASAIGAINGKPYQEWSKGLTGQQMQIVGGILQRADPSATVDIKGQQVPVNAFKTTVGPIGIGGAGGGG